MAYDEQQARHSRVVVETPTEKREVVSSQSVRTPDNSGISAGMVGVLVVVAIALITMLVLFWMSSQPASDQNANMVAQQPQQQPIIQQAPAQQPPATIQLSIDKQLTDDPKFSSLGITATVLNGKVTLLGTVKTEAAKSDVEKMVRRTKGVKDVDNQISVIPG